MIFPPLSTHPDSQVYTTVDKLAKLRHIQRTVPVVAGVEAQLNQRVWIFCYPGSASFFCPTAGLALRIHHPALLVVLAL